MTIASFYRTDRWGSRWGLRDAFHPTPHKGLDVAQNMPGVEVPAIESGVVVAAGKSTSVGNYITVQREIGGFRTYAHVVPYKFTSRARVLAGQGIGYEARNRAEGGTSWTGPHVHLCLSSTLTGWAYWTQVNVDPTPSLLVVLRGSSAAGGAANPINNSPKKDMDMITRRFVRQIGTNGVYAETNGVLRPMISSEHYQGTVQDWIALRNAGDPFLLQQGDASTVGKIIDVTDLRLGGILPATADDIKAADIDDATASAIVAGILAGLPKSTDTAAVAAIEKLAERIDANADDAQAAIATVDEAVLEKLRQALAA